MIQHIKAIYDHGVLRPLEPLVLDDQAVVSLSVEAPPLAVSDLQNSMPDASATKIAEPTLFDVFHDAGLIGCIKDAPSDLSTDPRHMEGFGNCAQ